MTTKFSQLFDEQQYHMLLFYLFLLYNYSKSSKEHIYTLDFFLGNWFLNYTELQKYCPRSRKAGDFSLNISGIDYCVLYEL